MRAYKNDEIEVKFIDTDNKEKICKVKYMLIETENLLLLDYYFPKRIEKDLVETIIERVEPWLNKKGFLLNNYSIYKTNRKVYITIELVKHKNQLNKTD